MISAKFTIMAKFSFLFLRQTSAFLGGGGKCWLDKVFHNKMDMMNTSRCIRKLLDQFAAFNWSQSLIGRGVGFFFPPAHTTTAQQFVGWKELKAVQEFLVKTSHREAFAAKHWTVKDRFNNGGKNLTEKCRQISPSVRRPAVWGQLKGSSVSPTWKKLFLCYPENTYLISFISSAFLY